MTGNVTAPPRVLRRDGLAIVAFLDLLGFRAAASADWPTVLEKLLRIKAKMLTPQSFVKYALETDAGKEEPFSPIVRVAGDSIIFAVGISPNDPPDRTFVAMVAVFNNLRFAWQAAVNEGFALRGAVDVGDMHWSDADMIGPGFISAYHLESNVADIARIILGPTLLAKIIELVPTSSYGDSLLNILTKSRGDPTKPCSYQIALAPQHIESTSNLALLEGMRDACLVEKHRIKYAELIAMLKDATLVQHPTLADLTAFADR